MFGRHNVYLLLASDGKGFTDQVSDILPNLALKDIKSRM